MLNLKGNIAGYQLFCFLPLALLLLEINDLCYIRLKLADRKQLVEG
jgi:hypothetical protein